MKVEFKQYPYPVLGNGDDLGGFFKVSSFHYELSKDAVVINPTFSLKNQAIEKLIRGGKASFVAEVQSRSTFFRTSFSTNKSIESFSFPAQKVRDRVTVEFYVCANEDIEAYQPSDSHPAYEGAVFEIEKGDVLAVGGAVAFPADKNFDPLRPPVSSFMSIREGSQHEGPLQIDYESEKITIILSKEDYRKYYDVRNQKPAEGMLHGAIVFPVLVDAIYQVRNQNSAYEAQPWFVRLETVLEAKGLREKEPIEAAQKILDNPAARSFGSMASLLEINTDEY